jgi:hypothetical protein
VKISFLKGIVMINKGVICGIYLLVFMVVSAYPEVTYLPLNKARYTIWESDSLFLGASMQVVDSTAEVVVVLKRNYPNALGVLYFMVPGASDSARFIFHNMHGMHGKYPEERDTVVLGKYPKNTKIAFRYVIIDTSAIFSDVRNKKLYTGQNREGVDSYISERSGPSGKRWAIVGSLGAGKCEVGFSAVRPGNYQDIRFNVLNVVEVK